MLKIHSHYFPWTLPPYSSCCFVFFSFTFDLLDSLHSVSVFPPDHTSATLKRVSTTTSSLRILHQKCQKQLMNGLILSCLFSLHLPYVSITSVTVDYLLRLKQFLSLVPNLSLLYLSGYLYICCIVSWKLKPN